MYSSEQAVVIASLRLSGGLKYIHAIAKRTPFKAFQVDFVTTPVPSYVCISSKL